MGLSFFENKFYWKLVSSLVLKPILKVGWNIQTSSYHLQNLERTLGSKIGYEPIVLNLRLAYAKLALPTLNFFSKS
jgi:hypothetical protein